MFYVYALKSKEGKLYIEQTNDLKRRLFEHNNGLTRYTTNIKTTWKLLYSEVFQTRSEAMKREKELKTGKGGEFIRAAVASVAAD